jgi:ankyrin repeat protein
MTCHFLLLTGKLDRARKSLEKTIASLDDKLDRINESLAHKDTDDMRKCPFCAEMIKKDAVRCMHCKSQLDTAAPAHPPSQYHGKGFFEAKEISQTEVVQLLLARCADVNAQDTIGFTALHSAAYKGNTEAVEQLLAKGADINHKDGFGRTALHWAAYKGRAETAKLLISKVNNVNEPNNSGWTPLHVAAWYGNTEVVRLLLASGADAGARDSEGRTPLSMATENDHQDVAKILSEQK